MSSNNRTEHASGSEIDLDANADLAFSQDTLFAFGTDDYSRYFNSNELNMTAAAPVPDSAADGLSQPRGSDSRNSSHLPASLGTGGSASRPLSHGPGGTRIMSQGNAGFSGRAATFAGSEPWTSTSGSASHSAPLPRDTDQYSRDLNAWTSEIQVPFGKNENGGQTASSWQEAPDFVESFSQMGVQENSNASVGNEHEQNGSNGSNATSGQPYEPQYVYPYPVTAYTVNSYGEPGPWGLSEVSSAPVGGVMMEKSGVFMPVAVDGGEDIFYSATHHQGGPSYVLQYRGGGGGGSQPLTQHDRAAPMHYPADVRSRHVHGAHGTGASNVRRGELHGGSARAAHHAARGNGNGNGNAESRHMGGHHSAATVEYSAGQGGALDIDPSLSLAGGADAAGNAALMKFTSLDQVQGRIYVLSKDQHGCRFLQRKLEENDAAAVQIILDEVFNYMDELMTDPFGNYLCQKLVEYCDQEQLLKIVESISSKLVMISLNMHGTRAVQKLIECLCSQDQVTLVVSALRPSVVQLIKDLNGNHVIQRCLNNLTPADKQFIYDAVAGHCLEVATHRHGCCVLQRCIDHASHDQKQQLITEITHHALNLVQDPFGNYVVQYVFDLQIASVVRQLIFQFAGHVADLATQKFSSNVIEKCLAVADEDARKMIVDELLDASRLPGLLQDPFANYVIQTALNNADSRQYRLMVEEIKPHLAALRNTPYGKRIQSRILKESRGGGGDRNGDRDRNDGRERRPVHTRGNHHS